MSTSHNGDFDDVRNLRVVFFGTPDFAVPAATALMEHTAVIMCVTQPDKPTGRSAIITPPPIKELARATRIPLYQPASLSLQKESGRVFFQKFQSCKPDIAIVVAYGKIIPKEYLAVPRFGFLNVHASLLPAYRGASPIQQALLQGETETGVTIMLLDEGLDTGPILTQKKMTIAPDETAQTLHDRLGLLGAELLLPTIEDYVHGKIQPQPQDSSRATVTSIISREDGMIDWSNPPEVIERKIRAFTPWPGTFTLCSGKRIKIVAAHLGSENQLIFDLVQPEGKKPMSYAEFIKGNPRYTLPPQAVTA